MIYEIYLVYRWDFKSEIVFINTICPVFKLKFTKKWKIMNNFHFFIVDYIKYGRFHQK